MVGVPLSSSKSWPFLIKTNGPMLGIPRWLSVANLRGSGGRLCRSGAQLLRRHGTLEPRSSAHFCWEKWRLMTSSVINHDKPQFWRVYVDTTHFRWNWGWFVLGVTLLDLFRRRKRHMGEMCLKVLHWVSYLFQPTKTRYVFQQHELME